MKRRDFFIKAGISIVSGAVFHPFIIKKGLLATVEANPPNLIFIFSDQLRFCDLGCMGNDQIKTPNFDKLAQQGVIMMNNYSCSPVCSPFRGQLMTGKYPWNNGVIRNGYELNKDQECFAEILKKDGYETGYTGKWHLYSRHGKYTNGFVPKEERKGWDFWAAKNKGSKPFDSEYFTDTPKAIKIEGFETDHHVDLALDFIKKRKNKKFALMISYNPPHGGRPPEEFDIYSRNDVKLRPNVPKKDADEAKRLVSRVWGLISAVDHYTGRLFNELDNMGLSQNTIIVYTSDHGQMIYSHGEVRKQRPWEESAHTPLIIRYPEKIKPGQKLDTLINSVDLMPTMLGLMNIPCPDKVDGKDLSSILIGKSKDTPESIYFSSYNFGEGPGFDWRGVRTREWKYAKHKNGDWVLYNMKKDPYEMTNLVLDPEHKNICKELSLLTDQWAKKTKNSAALGADIATPPPGELKSREFVYEKKRGRKDKKKGGQGKRGNKKSDE